MLDNWWKENSLIEELGGTQEAEDVVITVIPAMHLGQSPMLLILVTKSNTPQGERGVGATARRMIENQL